MYEINFYYAMDFISLPTNLLSVNNNVPVLCIVNYVFS